MTTISLGLAVASNADKASIDLDKLTASARRAEAGVSQLAGAAVKTHAATSQMSLNSANVAAQLQDVAVAAQMGMSPLQVALQQGTQLSAVLGATGGGLRGTVTALGTAFASIISPVSLATIAIIGLSTVGLQALGGILKETETATEALERHGDELARVVAGYDDAEGAVKDYLAEVARLPRTVVQIELGDELRQMTEEAEQFRQRVEGLAGTFSIGFGAGRAELAAVLRQFADGNMSASELVETLARMKVDPDVNERLRAVAGTLMEGAQQAATLEQALIGISHALAGTATNGGLQIALDSMIASQRSAEAHQIELDAIKALSPAQQAEIARRRERLKLVDEEISEALREQKIREAGELAFARASARASKSTTKEFDRFGNTLQSAQERAQALQLEIDLFGRSTYEIERQRIEMELGNAAKEAGLSLNARLANSEQTVGEAIAQTASATATATAELERMKYQQGQIDQLNGALASGFADLFIGILDGSKSAADGIADLLGSLGRLMINQAFQSLFAPTSVGGMGFNPFGALFGGGRASGGPVEAGKVYRVNENTPNSEYFAPAVNGAILTPTQVAANGNGGNFTIENITVNANSEKEGAAAARGFAAELNRHFPAAMERYQRNPLRRAG